MRLKQLLRFLRALQTSRVHDTHSMIRSDEGLTLEKSAFEFLYGGQFTLLYLPTEICFLIGGEHVTCGGSKLTNSLGRTNLTNALRKQQLELSTRT